jgi:hypothetical protein
MTRSGQCLAVFICTLWTLVLTAQKSPTVVTLAELSANPVKFDGRLVSVRASLDLGWEGDNFLHDLNTRYAEQCAYLDEFLSLERLLGKPQDSSFCLGFIGHRESLSATEVMPDFWPRRGIYFYSNPEYERQVFRAIGTQRFGRVVGWFTGYFHFVLNPRTIGAFNPGSSQFEAVRFSVREDRIQAPIK